MKYLITKKSDGSIVKQGTVHSDFQSDRRAAVELLLDDPRVQALTVDLDTGERIRYEL